MARVILRRVAWLLPLVWLVATLTFAVVHLTPGSYADALEHPRLTPEMREAIRARYGLDEPVHLQYLRWLGAVATGDLGTSFQHRRPVTEVILGALPPTVILAGTALVLDLALGIGVALLAVRRPHGAVDRVLTVLAVGVSSLPTFWVATLAVLVFAIWLGWLPASHMASVGAESLPPAERLLDHLRHLLLPAACLGVLGAGGTARYLRASLLDVSRARYIVAARARGIPEHRVLWVHSLRPALLPIVTMLGLSLPFLVGGSIVIEAVFSWPGMGLTMLQAAHARDVPLILGITVLGATAVVVGNLVSDVLYAAVDPRAREER